MKKKVLFLICTMCMTLSAVNAESYKVHVAATETFNTANPAQKIAVKVIDEADIGNYNLQPDDVLYCDVIKVSDPKRGKRSASFAVRPTYFITGEYTVDIKDDFYGKYADKVLSKEELKKIDKVQVGKKAVLTVGNHFVKGLTTGVTLAEGMIENQDGNRIESGVKKVYKESPLSYVEKGQDVKLVPGEQFYLIFKPSNSSKSADIEKEILNED